MNTKDKKIVSKAQELFPSLRLEIDTFLTKYKSTETKIEETSFSKKETKVLADKKIQGIFEDWVHSNFPGHSVLGEEAEKQNFPAHQWMWYIDPIDGTTPFSRNIEEWGVIISLTSKGIPQLAWVYFPYDNAVYKAVRGRGASKNGKRIYTSKTKDLEKMIITSVYMDTVERQAHMIGKLWNKTLWTFIGRSLAKDFSELAEGKVDVSVCYNCAIWEYKALNLLVTEAGGMCYNFDQKVFDSSKTVSQNLLAIANKTLAGKVIKLVQTPTSI